MSCGKFPHVASSVAIRVAMEEFDTAEGREWNKGPDRAPDESTRNVAVI